jgi:hypothetical protein
MGAITNVMSRLWQHPAGLAVVADTHPGTPDLQLKAQPYYHYRRIK